jgi:hypothetical protein
MRERGKLLLELKGENYNDPIFDTLVRELSV